MSPTAGRDYPRSYAQLRGWFDEDGKCLDYLDWLRWPDAAPPGSQPPAADPRRGLAVNIPTRPIVRPPTSSAQPAPDTFAEQHPSRCTPERESATVPARRGEPSAATSTDFGAGGRVSIRPLGQQLLRAGPGCGRGCGG